MQKELVKAPLRFQNSFLSSLCERKVLGRTAWTSRQCQFRCGTLPVMPLPIKSLVGEMQK
jgi:hypothetical protein